MKRMKRWICMIIALCMVAGLMPVNTLLLHAHAEEGVASCPDDAHMWDEGEQTQEPTAEAPGICTFTCTQCGETRIEEIPYEAPVCSHIWDEGEETQEPTAEAPGVCTFTCTQCGETRIEEIPYEAPVCSHIWDEGEETQEPTAEAPGIRTFTCTQCGETTNEEIPFEAPICNHVWDEGEETQEATAEAPGVRTFTCTLCGETKIEEIPYEAPVCNHQWDEGESVGTQMVYTCTLCGEQMPQEIAATQDDVSWVLPCSFTSILTPFGYRESSITGESTYHQGVDLDTGTGDPVVASRDGVILAANYSNSAGYYVQIDHQDGFRSIYMHLSSYSVSVGQSVSAGQYIGATGATGTTSNEDHLHFGISLNGVYINPENYVDLSVEKEDEIPIDENHFPDEVFRSYVAQNFDTDSNSALSVSECEAVTAINVGNKGIRSLKGIAYFSQLQTLFVMKT